MILNYISILLGLPYRENASAAAPIPTINTIRLTNFTNAYGGNQSINGTPEFDIMISQPIHVYPDLLGMSAWVILFSYPFLMIWVAHSDMRLAGVVGAIMGLYISLFIPSQYLLIGVACITIGIAVTAWGIMQKRA